MNGHNEFTALENKRAEPIPEGATRSSPDVVERRHEERPNASLTTRHERSNESTALERTSQPISEGARSSYDEKPTDAYLYHGIRYRSQHKQTPSDSESIEANQADTESMPKQMHKVEELAGLTRNAAGGVIHSLYQISYVFIQKYHQSLQLKSLIHQDEMYGEREC